jgi:putative ABC transport system permease protein
MKKNWIFLFLVKSISQRTGRLIVAVVSVTLAVAVITGITGITAGISEKLGSELKAYGANIIVAPAEGGYLDYDMMSRISGIDSVDDAVGQVLGNVFIENQSIEMIGLDVETFKNRGWQLTGNWPEKQYEVLAGIDIKIALNLTEGMTITLQGGSKSIDFVVSGFIEKGGAEDRAVILSIADAWDLTGLKDRVSTFLVRAWPGELNNAVQSIKSALPAAEVKTFRQVAFAEEALLHKVQLLMFLVAVVVLFASFVSVASTVGANLFERREEIGLMMAIGATRKEISFFYTAEALLIGLLGSLAGFVLGYISIQVISKGAFDSYISMPFYLVFISSIAGLVISVAASHFPVRDALKYSPAEILRGE